MRAAAIQATTIVPAPQEEVFAYLSDLGNHWELADRFVDVLSLDRPAGDPAAPATGGRVRGARARSASRERPPRAWWRPMTRTA
jgi:hypothetical protein